MNNRLESYLRLQKQRAIMSPVIASKTYFKVDIARKRNNCKMKKEVNKKGRKKEQEKRKEERTEKRGK